LAGKKRVGIVLFQLGGPDSLKAVEPFLLNLFLDPDIIPLGPFGLLRRPIAKLISSRRSIPVAVKYGQIGRRSPIETLTERQRLRLVEAVSPYLNPVAVVAMRYWHPFTAEAWIRCANLGHWMNRFVAALPHYSYATTLSSLKEWRRTADRASTDNPRGARRNARSTIFTTIRCIFRRWFNGSDPYCGNSRQFAHSSGVQRAWPADEPGRKGRPYPKQIEETVRLACELGARSTLAGQDAFAVLPEPRGPREVAATAAYRDDRAAGHEGVKEMLVVPISFVTEHIETLHEITSRPARKLRS